MKVEKIKEAIAKCQVSRRVIHVLTGKTKSKKNGLTTFSIYQPTISGFVTAVELGHQRKRVCKITTGSKQLDTILGG